MGDETVRSGIKYRQLGGWGKQPFSGASLFAWNADWQAGGDRSELKISLSFGGLKDNLAQSPPSADGETKAQRDRLLQHSISEQSTGLEQPDRPCNHTTFCFELKVPGFVTG